jgi:hypothetical protein
LECGGRQQPNRSNERGQEKTLHSMRFAFTGLAPELREKSAH